MLTQKTLWLYVSFVLCLQACSPDYEKASIQRSVYMQNNTGDIVIVGIEQPESTDYINGVKLAVQEVKARPNKLLGRSLRLIVEQDGTDFEDVLPTLHSIAGNTQVTAVLGHKPSIAIPASVIYEKSQIIFLSPFSTVKGLTNHNFGFVFQMIPNDVVMADRLVSIAEVLGYQKIVSLYNYTDYFSNFAFSFEDAALKANREFVFRSSFSDKTEDYRSLISRFQNEDIDAIFLSSETESGARMVQQLREMGLDMPILSGDGLKPKEFGKTAGRAGDNTVIPMIYDPGNKSALNQHFRDQYRKTYKTEADYNAAQGYDSVMLLVAAIEKAKSTVPTTLSSTLRYLPFWNGVTGLHAFNSTGEILGKQYYFQVMKNNKWHIIPAIHSPYNLKKFEHDKHIINPDIIITDFQQQFAKRLHPIDFKKMQLDLMHEVLHYNRLGWIYDSSDDKTNLVEKKWLQTLAKHKKFIIKDCGISFSRLSQEEIRTSLIDCYGSLALKVDAIYLTVASAMEPGLMRRLNRALQTYRVPVLAFRTDHKPLDMGVTIELDRADIKIDSPQSMAIFSGLMTKFKGFELVDKLANMPIITADLQSLSDYGYLSSKDLLTLAPILSEE